MPAQATPQAQVSVGAALGLEAPQKFRSTGWGPFFEAGLRWFGASIFDYELTVGWWRLEATNERRGVAWLGGGVRAALQPESNFFFRSGLTAGVTLGDGHPALGTFFGAGYGRKLQVGVTARADIAPFSGALLFSIGWSE